MAARKKNRNPLKTWLPSKHPGNKPGSSPKTPPGKLAPKSQPNK